MKKCNECRFAIFEEHGYSNYTVEGSDFYCAKKLHPEITFDNFYGENPKLEHAEKCIGFVKGDPFVIDVEKEALQDPTEEQQEILAMRMLTNLVTGKTE